MNNNVLLQVVDLKKHFPIAQDICQQARPEWRDTTVGGGHWVACHCVS